MSTTTVLNDVKLLLGLQTDDEKLETIVRLTEGRLKALLSVKIIPDELEYIITEVSIKRFNRIGSEGVQTHSVEGESMSFNDDDFSSSLLRFNLGEMSKPIKIKERFGSYEVR